MREKFLDWWERKIMSRAEYRLRRACGYYLWYKINKMRMPHI